MGNLKNRNSIMPEDDEEFISLTQRTRSSRKLLKKARRKLETPVAPAMLCKTCKKKSSMERPVARLTRGKTIEIKSNLACILEASESTRMRMEESLPNNHQDHMAAKGNNSLRHYNLVHKFIPMPQAVKIPAAKAAVDKGVGKIGENFGVELDESQK